VGASYNHARNVQQVNQNRQDVYIILQVTFDPEHLCVYDTAA